LHIIFGSRHVPPAIFKSGISCNMLSLTKKRTIAKKPQLSAGISAPPATSPTSALMTPATHVMFHQFIELANLNTITLFLTTAASTPDGEDLEFLWKHAFKEGQRVGLDEGHHFVDGMDIQEVLKVGFEQGQAVSMAAEKQEWQTKGHGENCIEALPVCHFSTTAIQATNIPPPCPMAMTAVQVDLPKPLPILTPPTVYSIIQTIPLEIQDASSQTMLYPSPILEPRHATSPPPLVNVNIQTSVTTEPSIPVPPCLNWAEDATSLPILPLLPTSTISPH